jgi:hypothetical protein
MDVKVLSEELTSMPPGLAAERYQNLALPTYSSKSEQAHWVDGGFQQQQQQQ